MDHPLDVFNLVCCTQEVGPVISENLSWGASPVAKPPESGNKLLSVQGSANFKVQGPCRHADKDTNIGFVKDRLPG